MPFLILVECPNCGREYRYSDEAPEEEMLCPFADCLLVGDEDDDD